MRQLKELPWRDPLEVFAGLSDTPWTRLLLSTDGAADARWSIVAAEPARTLRVEAGRVEIDGEAVDANPFDLWAEIAAEREAKTAAGFPFLSGAVGFVGYEAAPFADAAAPSAPSPGPLPTMEIGFYDAALLFDHEERRIWLSARGDAPATERLLRSLQHGCGPSGRRPAEAFLDSDCSRANYVATVETFIAQVLDGDFFQANLTRMIRARFRTDVSPFDLFRAMVAADPAPHAAFLRSDRGAAASISPERFFRIEPMADGRRVSAEPVKGTAPRRRDGERDRASAAALLASEKDRAENAMIVDLLRNDLAKVCREGTIEVPEFCALRSYAGVHHLTSRVEGVLRAGVGAAETMRALFPCGSITGAPKIEAMRAIRAVEGRGRGIYTGAIGYADDGGGADFSVAIRTAEIAVDARTEALYGVGGGVTMLSDPQAEYDETEAKAATFLRALAALSAGRAA